MIAGVDYNFIRNNVPNMTLDAATRKFSSITFLVGPTFSDNILEGQEYFTLRISQSNSLQVGQTGSIIIYIGDATGTYVEMIWQHIHEVFHLIGFRY